jgi:hypothetical protein
MMPALVEVVRNTSTVTAGRYFFNDWLKKSEQTFVKCVIFVS